MEQRQPATLKPGSRLGRYEIVSALGAGGEVYRAHDPRLDEAFFEPLNSTRAAGAAKVIAGGHSLVPMMKTANSGSAPRTMPSSAWRRRWT